MSVRLITIWCFITAKSDSIPVSYPQTIAMIGLAVLVASSAVLLLVHSLYVPPPCLYTNTDTTWPKRYSSGYPGYYPRNGHHRPLAVQPTWIIHRTPTLPPRPTYPHYYPLFTTTPTPTPSSSTTMRTKTELSPTQKRKFNKNNNNVFTAEQEDMNKDFVVTDSYKSEEVTEPPMPKTVTPLDISVEHVYPYRSPNYYNPYG